MRGVVRLIAVNVKGEPVELAVWTGMRGWTPWGCCVNATVPACVGAEKLQDTMRRKSNEAVAAEPIMLLPGLLCDGDLWRAQVAAFSPLRQITIPDLTRQETIADLALSALADAPPRFALAGLSMGGYVAMEIMRIAADRVTRLALLDTSARPDTPEQSRRRQSLIALSKTGQFKGVTPRLLKDLVHPTHQTGPIADMVMAMAARIGRDAFIRQQTAIIGRVDSRPSLGAIAVPTIVVVGEHDTLTPPAIAVEIADLIPGARLRLVPESGHLPPLEQPDRINLLLADWIA